MKANYARRQTHRRNPPFPLRCPRAAWRLRTLRGRAWTSLKFQVSSLQLQSKLKLETSNLKPLRLFLVVQSDAIYRRAFNLDVFRGRFSPVSFQCHAIFRCLRRQTKHELSGFAGYSRIHFPDRVLIDDSRQLDAYARNAAAVFGKNAAANESDRPFIDCQIQMVAKRAGLAPLDHNFVDRTDRQAWFAKLHAVSARHDPRKTEVASLVGRRARHLSFALHEDDGNSRRRAFLNTHFAFYCSGCLVLRAAAQ